MIPVAQNLARWTCFEVRVSSFLAVELAALHWLRLADSDSFIPCKLWYEKSWTLPFWIKNLKPPVVFLVFWNTMCTQLQRQRATALFWMSGSNVKLLTARVPRVEIRYHGPFLLSDRLNFSFLNGLQLVTVNRDWFRNSHHRHCTSNRCLSRCSCWAHYRYS